MPIDPRIALGVQPVQMPDFMGYANQAANILQSRASEQNALALMAQRQRQEQEVEDLRNYFSQPDFDVTSPSAITGVARIAPTIGGEALQKMAAAAKAQTEAQTTARAETSAARSSILDRLGAFNNPLEMYASLQQAKAKGVLNDLDYNSLVNSLRQNIRKDPVGGLEAFKDAVAFGRLTPTERLERENITTNVGGSIIGQSRRKYGAPDDPYTKTFVEAATMSPAERASHAIALARQEQEVRESNQRMQLARQDITSLPSNPGWGITKNQTIVRIPFAALPNEPKQVTRDPETGAYVYTLGDLDGRDFNDVDNARKARYTLTTIMGYGTQDFSNTLDTIRKTTKGLADKTASEITKFAGQESEAAQALAKFSTLTNNVVLGMLDYRVGAQVSDSDVKRFDSLAGVVNNENASIGERLAAFEEAVKIMTRIGYMPKDGYDPFKGKGLVGSSAGVGTQATGRRNLGVSTPATPGQGTVIRPPTFTPPAAAAPAGAPPASGGTFIRDPVTGKIRPQ